MCFSLIVVLEIYRVSINSNYVLGRLLIMMKAIRRRKLSPEERAAYEVNECLMNTRGTVDYLKKDSIKILEAAK